MFMAESLMQLNQKAHQIYLFVSKEKKASKAILYFSVLAIPFAVYCISIREELNFFRSFFSYTPWYSFGAKIFPYEIYALAKSLIKVGPIGIKNGPSFFAKFFVVVAFSMLAIRFSWNLWGRFRQWIAVDLKIVDTTEYNPLTSRLLDSFRMGSFLYAGTFAFTVVAYDYKLIFLLFTLPQIIY